MTKYELSLSPDYVPSWNLVDAVRELFQNAIDQEIQRHDNKMFYEYDLTTGTLTVGNKLSVLEPGTLLLGASSKREDTATIGQFGEGYKIAALVLTRLNKPMTIYNYGAREVWKPRFSKSRKYGSTILVFEVDSYSKWPFTKTPDNNLSITVGNLSLDEYHMIVDSNLHLQGSSVQYVQTSCGRIILNKERQVFVNGLYVCGYNDYRYSYDFKPGKLKLDRDRKLASDFDLRWLASTMWAEAATMSDETAKLFLELTKANAQDVAFVEHHIYGVASKLTTTFDKAYGDFKEEYGEDAEPVCSQEEIERLTPSSKPVIVSSSYKALITKSSSYTAPTKVTRKSTKDALGDWYDTWHKYLPKQCKSEFDKIYKEMI